jgi:two-component system phosphate regulon sensor histidine kinase PhoR
MGFLARLTSIVTGRAPDERGDPAAAIRSAVSEAQAARRTIEAERDRLRTLLAELGDAIVFADRDEVIQLANRSAVRLLGVELVGRRLIEVIRDHETLDAIEGARAGRESVAQVERDGGRRVLRVSVKPLGGGEILLAIQDLSSLRRLETQRRDFVANVSHELRTPLASLKAMVETLEDGAIDDRAAARDFLSRIHQEVDGLSQLVNELLALSRIESGEERLHATAVSPHLLLTQTAARMGPLAERAGVALAVDAAETLPAVRADAEQIGRVLTNLVHNALKFTPAGGTVTLGGAAAKDRVTLWVRDTGAGIEPDELERVFERFYKADRARATGGTGLGLAIAKHIVQAHGGTIVAASEGPGRGSTFTLSLPQAS